MSAEVRDIEESVYNWTGLGTLQLNKGGIGGNRCLRLILSKLVIAEERRRSPPSNCLPLKNRSLAETNLEIYGKELIAIVRFFEEWQADVESVETLVQVLSHYKTLKYFMSNKISEDYKHCGRSTFLFLIFKSYTSQRRKIQSQTR